MSRTLVISASRTKDLVRWSPGVLAEVLTGRRPCRFGWTGKPIVLDLSEIHTLVLWTKDPGPLVAHVQLREALEKLVELGGQVYLQLTVTGFGGTFVEWAVPLPAEVRGRLEGVLDVGLVAAGAVKLRYDPLLRISAGDVVVTNMRKALFAKVVDSFRSLGVEDAVTSYIDAVRYPKVRRRIEEGLGLVLADVKGDELADLVRWMAGACRDRGMRFDTCASPQMPYEREGCICGSRFNALMRERFGEGAPRCTERLHNEVTGGQRGECRCTYSRDIGYSAGLTTCYTHGSGCLYCYSHREALGPHLMPLVQSEVRAFLRDPRGFPSELGKEHYLDLVGE